MPNWFFVIFPPLADAANSLHVLPGGPPFLFSRSRAHHDTVGAPSFVEKPAFVFPASEERVGEITGRSAPGLFLRTGKTDNCSTPTAPEIRPSRASPGCCACSLSSRRS